MKRAAFTLLELLLVLALISAISGIGIVGYQRQHARSEFKSGLVELQVDLNRTRLLAMRSGEAYFFRFIPGSGIYEIAPLNTLQEAIYRMNGESDATSTAALGGSLSSLGADGYDVTSGLADFSTTNSLSYDNFGAASYGISQELASDDLFSDANIAADLQEAFPASMNSSLGGTTTPLAGSLNSDIRGATGAPSALGGETVVNPFAAISGDGLGTGGVLPLGAELSLTSTANSSITIREVNADEKPLVNEGVTIAWRVNNDGLVVRKQTKGNVIFTFSRLSESTPSNLRDRRPDGVVSTADAVAGNLDAPGDDLGSRLGGSLLAPPEATGSDALGGGLTAATSGIDFENYEPLDVLASEAPTSLWSEPILFYPNGRTSTVALGLASIGKYGYYSEIGLRGMTGYARISEITVYPTETSPDKTHLTQEQLFRMTNPGVEYTGTESGSGVGGGALGATNFSSTSGGALGGAEIAASGTESAYGSLNAASGYRFDTTGEIESGVGTATSGDFATGSGMTTATLETTGGSGNMTTESPTGGSGNMTTESPTGSFGGNGNLVGNPAGSLGGISSTTPTGGAFSALDSAPGGNERPMERGSQGLNGMTTGGAL